MNKDSVNFSINAMRNVEYALIACENVDKATKEDAQRQVLECLIANGLDISFVFEIFDIKAIEKEHFLYKQGYRYLANDVPCEDFQDVALVISS